MRPILAAGISVALPCPHDRTADELQFDRNIRSGTEMTSRRRAACASTEVISRRQYQGEKLARPGRTLVEDSAATELKTVVEGFQMTPQGLRRLGGGEVAAGGGKVPGALVPLAVAAARGNPIGLIVSAVKVHGETSGSATIQGAAKRSADEISAQRRPAMERQGWF
jgi:hypothetical protein